MLCLARSRGVFLGSVINRASAQKSCSAGVMRRVSMAVLKATARHTLRGFEIITPQAMHTHTARRAKSEAAREADFDEHRWDVRAFGCAGHDGRTR